MMTLWNFGPSKGALMFTVAGIEKKKNDPRQNGGRRRCMKANEG